jgi:drug/metabolite transporter (DMT)-like permease
MEKAKPIAALLLTMLIWGVTPVFLRSQSVGLGPADSLVIRYIPIALLWIVVLTVTGGWRIARSDWPRLLVVALIGLFGYAVASIYGFAYVPAGIGGLIYATQPLFIAFLAAVMLGERLTLSIILGLALAVLGTVLLLWDDLTSAGMDQSYFWGIALLLLSCFAWAFYCVPGKLIFQRYGSVPITAMSTIIATLPMLSFASPGTLDTLHNMTARQWLEVLFLAVCSTFIAMITWTYASAKLPASTTGAFLYLIPVIAVLAGVLVLGETLTLPTVLGGLCIILGVAVAQFRPRKIPITSDPIDLK